MSSRFAILVAVAVAACASDRFEYADPTDAGDATTGNGGSGFAGDAGWLGGSGGSAAGAAGSGGLGGNAGSTSSCSSGSSCASIPTGWNGPLYLYRAASGSTPPSCPNADPAVLDGFIGMNVGTSTCGCSCSGTSTCANSLTLSISQTGCGAGTCGTKNISLGSCIELDKTCSAYVTVSDAPAGGPCTPVPSNSFPTPTWAEIVKACAAPKGSSCVGGTCVGAPPTPFSNGLCIGKSGDVACNAPGYAKKVLAYESYQDSRSCGSCYCTPKKCGQISIFPNGCSSSVSKQVLPGTCGGGYAVSSSVLSVWARYSAIGGACAAKKPSLSGDVKESGAYTICCEQ